MTPKTFITGLGALPLLGGLAAADILITEIVDATLPGGLPKYVELTNTGATTVDLAGYSIGNFNNGGTTLGGGISTVLSGMLDPGASYVISYENSDGPGVGLFFTTYGFDPSNFDQGANINGNDAVALYLADGTGPNGEATGDGTDATLVDVYGTIGVDPGTGLWAYTDSYAYRCGTTASATFDDTDWVIAGVDALEAGCGGDDICETANILMLTTPFVNPGCGGGGPFTSVCFGDGTGAPCGCGNESAPGAGAGCLNTAGVGGVLSASGTPSVSADTMTLTADGVINQPGLFFQGNNAIGGGTGSTFGDGIRCCGQNVVRIEVVNPPGTASPATAQMTELATANGPAGTVNAGDTKCYQYWYRDPAGGGVCGTSFNLTNAVSVTWSM